MRTPKKPRGRVGSGLRGGPAWQESEKVTASRGGRRTRASGAVPFDRMDVVWEQWGLRVENKHTEAKGFRVSADLLEKAWRQARDMSQFPVVLVDMPVAPQDATVPGRWVILPESTLLELIRSGTV